MAYNSTDLVQGQDVFLWLGASGDTGVLAFATSVQLQVDSESISTTNKMSCAWASNLPGTKSYTISSDALYTAGSGHTGYDSLMKLMLSADTDASLVDWWIGTAVISGDTCEAYQYGLDTTKPYYHGKAQITSLSMNAGNVGEIASCSISLTGDGAPKQEGV